jgi:hypothetical protein
LTSALSIQVCGNTNLYDEADVALRERLEAMFVPVVAALPHGFMRPHRPKEACGLLSRDRC